MPHLRNATWFQSAPAITGGRCPSFGAGRGGIRMFQSAPAITGGRCNPWAVAPGVSVLVSIRARHYWRAMPKDRAVWVALVLFQSAPAITGGRCNVFESIALYLVLFQSAPAITGGRCGWSRIINTHPQYVSIRARHYWRAMRGIGWRGEVMNLVSIRARHYWRAMPQQPIQPTIQTRFNPRPPLLAGDACRE